ncbi:hypothetical protein BHE74_00051880 [Ensete ventricosum]|nr:hypothetical protein GW17_00019164 [Ensete ventricosum]RWW42568.1 hypothetical protein BHE74_00051880 [Ensete ventricosum]
MYAYFVMLLPASIGLWCRERGVRPGSGGIGVEEVTQTFRRIVHRMPSRGRLVIFRSPTRQSLSSKFFVKKLMELSSKDVIGSGGSGTVYRLAIDETTAFAVKRLNKGTNDTDHGFERELAAMGDIKHRNIASLNGYYIAPQFNFLIYELMPNGSLDALLHGSKLNDLSINLDFI